MKIATNIATTKELDLSRLNSSKKQRIKVRKTLRKKIGNVIIEPLETKVVGVSSVNSVTVRHLPTELFVIHVIASPCIIANFLLSLSFSAFLLMVRSLSLIFSSFQSSRAKIG